MTRLTLRMRAATAARRSFDAMLACEHVQVTPDGRAGSLVDDALEEQGLTRFVRMRMPGFAGLPAALVGSDRVAVVPARVVEVLGRLDALQVLPLPLAVGSFAIDMYWHVHRAGDAGLRFVRKQLAESARRERTTGGEATTLHDVRRRRRRTL